MKNKKLDLLKILGKFPSKDHVQKICKIHQGRKTCRFRAIYQRRNFCTKCTDCRISMNNCIREDKRRPHGDNCPGIIDVVIQNQSKLKGHQAFYYIDGVKITGEFDQIVFNGKDYGFYVIDVLEPVAKIGKKVLSILNEMGPFGYSEGTIDFAIAKRNRHWEDKPWEIFSIRL